MIIINKELIEAAHKYVNGEMAREQVIQKANGYFKLESYHEESLIFNFFNKIFEDPEDNELRITRNGIIRVLDNHIRRLISLEEVEHWFWDVIDLTVEESDSEEDLIYYLLYLLDNIAINGITEKHMIEIYEILISIPDAVKALEEVKKIFENKYTKKNNL